MSGVFGEILKKKFVYGIFLVIALFYILDIANEISRKVLVLEARNFYQLIEYNE